MARSGVRTYNGGSHGEAGPATDLGEGLDLPVSADTLEDRLARYRQIKITVIGRT